jgi:hypothetical protein
MFGATSVLLQFSGGGIPGDYNGDGNVDAADYVVWRKTDGTPAGYNTWQANFGNTSGAGSGSSPAAVPEPSACLILAIGLATLCARPGHRLQRRGLPANTACCQFNP